MSGARATSSVERVSTRLPAAGVASSAPSRRRLEPSCRLGVAQAPTASPLKRAPWSIVWRVHTSPEGLAYADRRTPLKRGPFHHLPEERWSHRAPGPHAHSAPAHSTTTTFTSSARSARARRAGERHSCGGRLIGLPGDPRGTASSAEPESMTQAPGRRRDRHERRHLVGGGTGGPTGLSPALASAGADSWALGKASAAGAGDGLPDAVARRSSSSRRR